MTTLSDRPEIPIQIITSVEVRASIGRAKRSLLSAAEEVMWQIEMEAWRTLGYRSWNAMREAEYGGAAFMVPPKNRPELVSRMKAKQLSQREMGRTAGVDEGTVRNDLRGPSADISALDDDVIDAEIVEDDEISPNAETGPVAADPAPTTVACPTCGGTGKVTR